MAREMRLMVDICERLPLGSRSKVAEDVKSFLLLGLGSRLKIEEEEVVRFERGSSSAS